MKKRAIEKAEIENMAESLRQLQSTTDKELLSAAADMLIALQQDRDLALCYMEEAFKAVSQHPQRPADAYFAIIRFRKETGR